MAKRETSSTQKPATADGPGPAGRPYGPANPHSLSGLQTELVWEGKYDEYGNRRGVDAEGAAMPMQRIETIDEPRARVEAQGDLFDSQHAHLDDFRNRLIWGDNKLIASSLLREFKASFDLIYIDPPFDVGADFTMTIPVGDQTDRLFKDQSALEMVAYRDMWGRGTDSYLHTMYERLVLMRDLLRQSGHIFVHLSPVIGYYFRSLMDEVFGRANFRNEIVINRPITKNLQRQFDTIAALPQGHDVILWYSASADARVPNLLVAYEGDRPEGYWHRFWSGADRPTMRYELLGETPTHGQWKWKKERAEQALANYERYLEEGNGRTLVEYWRETDRELAFIRKSASGTVENWFPPSEDKVGDTVWEDIKAYENQKEFPTQKHRELLTRIIDWTTEEGDLVGDFFCGSGTTGVVAEQMARKWVMADLGRFAIHTSRKRLIEVQREMHGQGRPYRAFDVLNLGRYERQWWQKERLRGADEEHRRVVLEFFKAEELVNPPSPLLHGRKAGAFCHVDAIDTIFTRSEATAVSRAARDAGAREVICLSWEFEMDLRLECNRLEKELSITIKLVQIPREIMEKNRKEPPPFLEVATLTAEAIMAEYDGVTAVDIRLTSFLPSLSEIPTRELEVLKERAVKSGFDFVDFWAVDFDYANGGPFHHDWQDYRLRKDRSLKLQSEQHHVYPAPGEYTACVKVVDIFGCDTSISVEVLYE
jgi:adenine-specific DNA-methyltransferase